MSGARCVRGAAAALSVAAVLVAGSVAGASDATTAKKLVITKADVAKAHVGHAVVVATPGSSGGAPSDTFATLADCVGKPVPGRAVVAVARGPELVDQTGHSEITSNADMVQTKAMARADRAVVQSRAFPQCLAQLAEQQVVPPNATITSVDAHRIKMKRHGDYSTAVLAQAHGTSNGTPGTITSLEVLTIRGRAELSDHFVTNGATPFDRRAAEKILDELAQRLDAARV